MGTGIAQAGFFFREVLLKNPNFHALVLSSPVATKQLGIILDSIRRE